MKQMLLSSCLLSLCTLTLFAQGGRLPQALHSTKKSSVHVPPEETPASLKKIYSNLRNSNTDLYNDTDGWEISGPNSNGNRIHFFGLPFTPKTNAHVSQVQLAVQYVTGANQVNISIYGDAGGVPGTLLAGPVTVTNLSMTGTCCTLALANFSPVAVTGGSRYWVVADTPPTGTGSDFIGEWEWIAKPNFPQAFSNGHGWFGTINSPTEGAGEVLGTLP